MLVCLTAAGRENKLIRAFASVCSLPLSLGALYLGHTTNIPLAYQSLFDTCGPLDDEDRNGTIPSVSLSIQGDTFSFMMVMLRVKNGSSGGLDDDNHQVAILKCPGMHASLKNGVV